MVNATGSGEHSMCEMTGCGEPATIYGGYKGETE